MNPSGDHGKRELSPAFRNRFTEIWVPSLVSPESFLENENGIKDFFKEMISNNFDI